MTIYLVYFFILLGAVSWRLARAASDDAIAVVKDCVLADDADFSSVKILTSRSVRPAIRFCKVEGCLELDMPSTVLAKSLFNRPFAGKGVKLAYFYSVPEKNTLRARIFLENSSLPRVSLGKSEITIRLSQEDGVAGSNSSMKKDLLDPVAEKNAPVVLNFAKARLKTVLLELARNAGIELHISGSVPEHISLDLQAPDPFSALRKIVKNKGLAMNNRGKVWVINGVKNG